jgi:outer membrane lipoprotein-sorting protein
MQQVIKRTAMALTLVVGVAGALQAQTADELVAKNLAAKGGVAKLKAVQGMRISGHVTLPSAQGGVEIPMTILTKRPNRFRQESTVQGTKIVIAFDGTQAWMVNPLMGADTPRPITGDQAELLKQQADLDGPLMDYKTKGTTIEVVGSETLDGKRVNKLKVTPKSGRVVYLYLDAETGLETKTTMDAPADPNSGAPPAMLEIQFSNYQNVGGLMMPHSISQKLNGQVAQVNIDKIELSPAIEDSVFAMPAGQPPAAAAPR